MSTEQDYADLIVRASAGEGPEDVNSDLLVAMKRTAQEVAAPVGVDTKTIAAGSTELFLKEKKEASAQ